MYDFGYLSVCSSYSVVFFPWLFSSTGWSNYPQPSERVTYKSSSKPRARFLSGPVSLSICLYLFSSRIASHCCFMIFLFICFSFFFFSCLCQTIPQHHRTFFCHVFSLILAFLLYTFVNRHTVYCLFKSLRNIFFPIISISIEYFFLF